MQRRAEAGFSRLPFTIYLFPPRLFAITDEEEGGEDRLAALTAD